MVNSPKGVDGIHRLVCFDGMDKLKTLIKPMSPEEREDFAARCGTTWHFLRNVMYGQRTAGEKLCVAIERESGRAVTRQDMREDWREIWPELPEPAPAQQESPYA